MTLLEHSRRPMTTTSVWALALGAALAACSSSDDNGGGGGTLVTQSPPETPVAEAGAQDIKAVCDYYVASIDAQSSCKVMGVSMTAQDSAGKTAQELVSSCQGIVDSCLGIIEQSRAAITEDCQATWFGADCQATIAQVQACTDEMKASSAQNYAAIGTCQTAELSQPLPVVDNTLPASCSTVLSVCPEFFRTTDAPPSSDEPAVVTSCEARCDEYVAACQLDSCPESCSLMATVYGEACNDLGKAFYDCAASSTYDCSETDLMLAIDGCSAERADYLTCFALDGVTCRAEATFDEYCVAEDAAYPYARRCVSSAAPAECVPYMGTNYFCCPTQ
jgi:hypothetical protein